MAETGLTRSVLEEEQTRRPLCRASLVTIDLTLTGTGVICPGLICHQSVPSRQQRGISGEHHE